VLLAFADRDDFIDDDWWRSQAEKQSADSLIDTRGKGADGEGQV